MRVAVAGMVLGTSLAACSSGAVAGGPADGGSCNPAPGNYLVHYIVVGDGGHGCTAPADTTVTVSGNTFPMGGPTSPGASCTISTKGCTFASDCTVINASVTVTIRQTESFSASGGSGTTTSTVTTGGQTTSCTLDFTLTKE